jgi:hypothetical protein
MRDDEMARLQTEMGSAFVFSDQTRQARGRKAVESRMAPILTALLSQNEGAIEDVVISPVDKFQIVLGKDKTDFLTAHDAIRKLSEEPLKLSCYQARPMADLSSIAAVAAFSGKKKGAVVAFDNNGKLASVMLMPPSEVAFAMGIDTKQWLDPKNPNCSVDGQ